MDKGSGLAGGTLPRSLREGVARTIHENYLRDRLAEGRAPGSEPALRSWDDLPEHLRDANRAQADGYATHLAALGYTIAAGVDGTPPPQLVLRSDDLERMAEAEHERWMEHKVAQGYRYGARRVEDGPRRSHPWIVAWRDLPEAIRDLDRQPLRRIVRTLSAANLWIVPRPPGPDPD
ncbi:MAG: RyR domain-containing protein [Frankia sp.]